jgi:FtsH-binding integral membrane protein
MIIEQGVMGLLLFLVLLGATFWYVQRIYRTTTDRFWKVVMATTGAIMVMECTVNFLSDMIETDKIGSVFYMCIAVVAVASLANRQTPAHKTEM